MAPTLKLNLEKARAPLKLSLEKAGILTMPVIDMALAMDVSGSFQDEHEDGITTDLMTRLAPYGLMFDPDKKIDVFTFSNGAGSAHKVGDLNEKNYENYVRNNIISKVPGWNGGTDYSHVLEAMLKEFGWIATEAKKSGFLSRMMGKKDDSGVAKAKKRSLIFFVTDGDNNDHSRTMQVLQESEGRKDEIYFLFLGVSNGGSQFPFLEKIGDKFGNTGFREIKNVRKFIDMSDEQLTEFILDKELTDWLKK